MINTEKILLFLESQSSKRFTNSSIAAHVAVKPHQQVFQITQGLMKAGKIRGVRRGGEWEFWVDGQPDKEVAATQACNETAIAKERQENAEDSRLALSPAQFEVLASKVLSSRFGKALRPAEVPGVPKRFDLVSDDRSVVGDAKYYTMVGGERIPPAKFSVIAEYVWMLEKTGAANRFLVFGYDDRVPIEWLARYRHLVDAVDFYFLSNAGDLSVL